MVMCCCCACFTLWRQVAADEVHHAQCVGLCTADVLTICGCASGIDWCCTILTQVLLLLLRRRDSVLTTLEC
jgi:hypothetical protein